MMGNELSFEKALLLIPLGWSISSFLLKQAHFKIAKVRLRLTDHESISMLSVFRKDVFWQQLLSHSLSVPIFMLPEKS